MTLPVVHSALSVSLRRLFPTASFVGCADIAVNAAMERSSDCTSGCLYAALPGTKTHGREFVAEACARGATTILTDRPLSAVDLPQCILADARRGFSELCHALHGYPSKRLGIVGVTGTNGKTTTTYMLRSILESAGRRTGLLGTIAYNDGIQEEASSLTTPDSATLARWLAAMVARRTTHAALELSSHALTQHRTAGLGLDAAVVTNVTQDHYDYHGSWVNYRSAKAEIFKHLKRGGVALLNADDPGASSMWELVADATRVATFGIDRDADYSAHIIEATPTNTRFRVRAGAEELEFTIQLTGKYNVSNALAAIAASHHFGLSLAEIQPGLEELLAVPGRLEAVDVGQPFRVFIDYAHTSDALHRVLSAVRPATKGRVICVFGAGGDRDRSKRPLMAQAAQSADVVIVTSDNPRHEAPDEIIRDIMVGFAPGVRPIVEPDREVAIERALEIADEGDCVLITGKGHEKFQIVGSDRIDFDDAAVCRSRLRSAMAVTTD